MFVLFMYVYFYLHIDNGRWPSLLTVKYENKKHQQLPALTSYYSKQTNYMGIFTVSGWCMFVSRARHTPNTPPPTSTDRYLPIQS